MFKRIVKVVGFVLLGFVLLIGGVVGFMAIRGDFKKQVIKPTAIDFSITKTNLTFDASLKGDQTLENEQIFSFTISAQPLDVTETECTLKLSNSSLITFVEYKEGKWIEYKSNKFYLNRPIYFKMNDITEENVEDYYDGILTITVKDKSGLLQDTLDLEIDRSVTSISFKDIGKEDNNKIINGLFAYEDGKYEGITTQTLEAIEGEDYPLEVITAPLKASKPFNSKDTKIIEIYYIEEGQPQLLVHNEEVVKLQRYDDQGQIVEEDCDFLTYDTTNNYYVFNSGFSGNFEFKLATYPTYAIQEEILNQDKSFIERLQSEDIVTKSVVITVNGSEAEQVVFEGDNSSINMQLLQNNKWIVNNSTTLDMYDLGLILSKTNSGTEINSRYNELKFLTSDDFTNTLSWTFKKATIDGENITYDNSLINVTFIKTPLGAITATISGLDAQNIDNTADYKVSLTSVAGHYILTLTHTIFAIDGQTKESETTITFNLIGDNKTGKVLSLEDFYTEDNLSDNNIELTKIEISKQDYKNDSTYTPTAELYKLEVGNCFILDNYDEDKELFNIKTLKPGIYLAILGRSSDVAIPELINDKFITSIDYDGANSIIDIMPIDGEWANKTLEMYAIVVNTNGSWIYTHSPREALVTELTSSITLSNNGDLRLPVVVGESLNYATDIDVKDLFSVQEGGSYNQILLFAPKYSLLTMDTAPSEWGKGLIVYDVNGNPLNTAGIPYEEDTYYTKNNYATVDLISIEISQGTIDGEYFLLGYIENNQFVNKVVATGANYYSKLYPVLVRSKYIIDQSRLQTAEEFVNDILANKFGTSNLKTGGEITYDLSLLPNRQITKTPTMYVATTGAFSESKTYYTYNEGDYIKTEVPLDDINNWLIERIKYFEKVDVLKAETVLGAVTIGNTNNINTNLNYYTLTGETLTLSQYSIGSDDFVNEWKDYYVIITHYAINSHTDNGIDLTINAYAYSNNIKLPNIQTLELLVSDYQTAITGKFNVNYSTLYVDNFITANSYYDFANSSVHPTVSFSGTYFEHSETKVGNNYQIIAGHKDVDVDWNGEKSATNAIQHKTVKTSVAINHANNEAIAYNIVSNLTIRTIEYNEVDGLERVLTNITPQIVLDYVPASSLYNPSMKYYKLESGNYNLADIDATIISDWANKYTQYYVGGISAEFEISSTLDDGHYIRFEWIYTNGDVQYKMDSPKLMVLSREVKGYSIDVSSSIDGSDIYKAILITQETYEGDYYKYNEDTASFALESVEPYQKDTYYTFTKIVPTDEISYQLQVGYDAGYTYTIYAVDNDGHYLTYIDANNDYAQILASVGVALKLRSDGGWIKPIPLYGINPQFNIIDNSNIKLKYNAGSQIYEVDFAQISDDFTTIKLQSSDANISTNIKVKVDAAEGDNGFKINAPATTTDSDLTFEISKNMYLYKGTAIDNLLKANIVDFNIIRLGQNVSDLYEIKNNQVLLKEDNTKVIAELHFDTTKSQWILTRATYDNMTIDISFASVIKTETIAFAFTSPYDIEKSTTNTTTTIYTGTKFIIAKSNAEAVKDLDALYTFTSYDASGVITIRHDLMQETDDSIGNDANKWIVDLTTIIVDEPTNCTFTIYYNDNSIGSFQLTISPNILIGTNVNGLIKRDDLNNTEYNFSELQFSKYVNAEYLNYTTDLEVVNIEELHLSYEITTYTDAEFRNKYTTNVVTVANNKLTVGQISRLGTYYVSVVVYSGATRVGEVKFEIESNSQVVDETNHEIDDITLIAKMEQTYSIQELQKIFNLSRGGEVFQEVDTYVEDITYKFVNGKYELMQDDEGNGYYQKITNLTDILWFNTTNEHILITYNYAGKTLTQDIEYKYTEYAGDWVEGGKYYYINNSQYVLATKKQSNVTYYTLEIIQKLIYNDGTNTTTYKLLGTSYKMSGFTYDITNDCFKQGDDKLPTQMFGNNIAYYMVNSESVIYCKQNAYLFVNVANSNDILAMSIEDSGKVLYHFNSVVKNGNFATISQESAKALGYYYRKISENTYTLTYSNVTASNYYITNVNRVELGGLQSLTLKYDSFGKDLVANMQYIDTMEYGIELVFDNRNIKTNEIYNICIEPYTIKANTNVVLNGDYTLYDGTKSNGVLFNQDDNVDSIVFGSSSDYDLFSQTTIKFNANGNNYTTVIPVTITYVGGETYRYDVTISVVNSTVVNIKYPYNVDKSYTSEYNLFNASILDLTKSVDNLYNVEDFAEWLGIDTTIDNWQSSVRIKYDLALRSDTINLATNNELYNTTRYNVSKYERAGAFDSDTTYYIYNKTTNKFENVVLAAQPTDWSNLKYFTSINDTTPISKVEVVAASSTYAIDDEIIKSWFALNGNTIVVKSPADEAKDETLNLTGYVAFKVYAGDTGAYGYYVLKIATNDELDKVIGFGVARNTQTISHIVDNSDITIKDVLDSASRKINSVANSISADCVYENYTNVYLFKVSSENAKGAISNDNIANGQYVPINTKLSAYSDIQIITLAVVIYWENALVHVCNYEIVLKPNIEVIINNTDIEAEDPNRYIYTLKEDKAFKYDYQLDTNNAKNLDEYFSVIKDGNPDGLNSVEFVKDDETKPYSSWLTISEDKQSIYYQNDTDVIADVKTTTNYLTLKADVSDDEATFYLKLTYDSGFTIYLRIILAPFEFIGTTQFEVGGTNYNNTLNLSAVYGNYNKGYYILDTTDVTDNKGGTLTLASSNSEYSVNITITLTQVFPNISKTITIKFKPNIEAIYNTSYDGYSPTGTRVTPNAVTPLDEIGSQLYANIIPSPNGTSIVITSGDIANTYLTINVKEFSSVGFTLTSDSGDILKPAGQSAQPYQYFVGSDAVTLTNSDYLQFVHSASDTNLRLNVTVYNYKDDYYRKDGDDYILVIDKDAYPFKSNTYYDADQKLITDGAYSTTYALYITLPKTYELTSVYRVTGATYETVHNTADLIIKESVTTSIDKHFFGTETEVYTTYVKAGGTYSPNTVYYKYITSNYVASEPTETEIANWSTAKTNYYEKVAVNQSRIAIKVGGNYYYGYDNIKMLGIFATNNPNKLNFSVSAISNSNTSSIDNGVLTFRCNDNGADTILTMSNTTTSLEYNFKIFDQDTDYSNVGYNEELLQIDADPKDNVVDHISIPYSQLVDAEGNNLSVDLAYLEYDPTISGQVAGVVMSQNVLSYEFVRDLSAMDYVSKIVIRDNGLLQNAVYEIEFIIITINGVVESKVTLVISDFNVDYGYNKVNATYEYVYGGTQIGTLLNNDSNGNQRVTAKINTAGVNITGGSYTFDHVATINGHITQWYLGDNLPESTLVFYDKSNTSSKGMISLLNVANDTPVTLVFNVVDNSNNGLVLGRVFYKLMIQNNLKIGINPALNANSVIDLYLGSEIYDDDGNTTVIDLLQSQEGTGTAAKYNNLFITLEQYSTGNTIANNKALYNGDTNDELKTGSQLSKAVVGDYLRFSISEPYGEVKGNVDVKVDSVSAKLIITGNPSGSFRLNVSAANETGYGRSFVINVNKYDYTEAQFNDRINVYNGSGKASGTQIDLFKDIGLQSDPEDKQQGDYAFTSYRNAYGREAIKDLPILTSGAKVTYQVLAFDYGTTISEIKQADAKWDSITPLEIRYGNNSNPDTIKYTDDGTCRVNLPSVKASTETNGSQYQIVSYRLTISYNEDDTNQYYAHYLVYNADQIKINKHYQDNEKEITYGQGAWSSAGEGNVITLMDLNNEGLYSATTLVRNESAPDNWPTGYYSYDSNTGTFTSVPTGTAYAPNTYYTLNDIATNPGHYEFVIPEYNNGAGYICNLKLDGAEKITATLPNDLFKNKADIKIIIRAIDGGANVVEDEWTIQAGQTIIPYDSKPLSMFFLLSEIGQDLYQNYNIIGIGTSYNSFVEGGTYDSHSSQDLGDTDYELHTVLYKGSDGNNVFDVEETYYVLVGHSTVMSFAFNAGADYFINLTIDESNIIGNEASIKDFRKNFVTIWSYSGGKFVDATPTGISVSGLSSPFSYNEAGNDTLTVSNINKITTNQWKPVIIYDGSISRTIQLYFNIVINARETDDDGNDIFDEASGVMVKNDSLASAMAEQGDNTLTNDEISNNLKKELLSLIKFNDSPVVVDGVVDSVTLSRYSIEVIKDGSYYKITYTYTGTSATYTRTLTMSAS